MTTENSGEKTVITLVSVSATATLTELLAAGTPARVYSSRTNQTSFVPAATGIYWNSEGVATASTAWMKENAYCFQGGKDENGHIQFYAAAATEMLVIEQVAHA